MSIKSTITATAVALAAGLSIGATATAGASEPAASLPQPCRQALSIASDISGAYTQHLALSQQWSTVVRMVASHEQAQQRMAHQLGRQLVGRIAEASTAGDLLVTNFSHNLAACNR